MTIALSELRGKRFIITVLNTMMALPTVVVGLLVYFFICRHGPFGKFGLLFTPQAIVIGGVILATPIISALTLTQVQSIDKRVRKTAFSLGTSEFGSNVALLKEGKFGILAAIICGFGRVIAEVGSAMMLGGNIKGYTRTMTTQIALGTAKGEFKLSLMLGIVLLFIAFSINALFNYFQGKTK